MELLDSTPLGPKQLTRVLGGLGKNAGDSGLTQLEWTFRWAVERGLANERHYSRFISVLGAKGRWERAMEVFETMQQVRAYACMYLYL